MRDLPRLAPVWLKVAAVAWGLIVVAVLALLFLRLAIGPR